MKPEDQARQEINRLLDPCGWIVQDHREANISAGPGAAIREFALTTGKADYMLYLHGEATGVVEAKPAGRTLTGVETQSAGYPEEIPPGLRAYQSPLPFAYESTGAVTRFTRPLSLTLAAGRSSPFIDPTSCAAWSGRIGNFAPLSEIATAR
jgi:type I restriction enzyme R subunit